MYRMAAVPAPFERACRKAGNAAVRYAIMARHAFRLRGKTMRLGASVITVAAVLSSLLSLQATPATAADQVLWLADRQPAVMTAFSKHWQQLRGDAPVWLDQAPAPGTNASVTLIVRDQPAGEPASGSSPELFLRLPRDQASLTGKRAGIYAEASPAALLALWQQLLPDRQPAGILVGAGHQALWPQWQQAAQQLPLRPGFVRAGEQAQRVFALVRPGLGLLLYSAGTSAADPVALGVILRESLASGLPVLGTDPALLPAGALAVLHQEPTDLGIQAAALGVALLQTGATGAREPQPLHRQINFQVARSLQLSQVAQLDAGMDSHNNKSQAGAEHNGQATQTDKQP